MSAFDDRRDQDIEKLRRLQSQSRERVRVTRVTGRPVSEVDVELRVKTAPSEQYPDAVQNVTQLTISLPARYPFVEPGATIRTPIFHPNVYSSGRICLGVRWIPSLGLDLLVRRIVQIVTFDPAVLNEGSPANGRAATWYRQARRTNPGAFPTNSLALSVPEPPKTLKWANLTTEAAKTVVACPQCRARLSLPTGKRGRVACPKCGATFQAAT